VGGERLSLKADGRAVSDSRRKAREKCQPHSVALGFQENTLCYTCINVAHTLLLPYRPGSRVKMRWDCRVCFEPQSGSLVFSSSIIDIRGSHSHTGYGHVWGPTRFRSHRPATSLLYYYAALCESPRLL
jgi:hypothetical protein